MGNTNSPTLRKRTGGEKGKRRDKRKFEFVDLVKPIEVGKKELIRIRVRGGSFKSRPLYIDEGNMYDPKAKSHKKVKIIRVLENQANRSYSRMNIITKGSILETSEGKAKVVNRPGQTGQVSLVKID
ncbi:MAG: 30S ribosomal protein S8e [Candidatus Parvarchaeota archaeon]|nr:30S ribosomal protein S8e [Candidatus Parvarchaeota archaeon]MCW1301888.1 30S ribosomal protein S8e [Candidatus Parvarchaeota archaeon]